MSPPVRLLLHLTAFLVGSFLWMVLCGVLAFAWVASVAGLEAASDPDALMTFLTPGAMGVLTIVQIGGLAGLAAGLARWLPDGRDGLSDHLGFHSPPPLLLASAGVGALTIWTFPSWVATRLVELVPSYESTLELITTLLQTGSVSGRMVLAFAIVVTAPLCEELIFRGYLWSVLERALPPAAVWFGTSLLFAAYHMDPIHVVSLLPTALFLGFVRWVSGSVWPAILAHFVNNGIATLFAMLVPPGSTTGELGFVPSLLGLLFSIAVAAGGWALHRRAA